MAQPVFLPRVGMTMEEGILTRWLAEDGDTVAAGQPLFEMETEKVDMEVEAEAAGILRRLVDEGTTLQPGAIVGALLVAGEALPSDFLATASPPLDAASSGAAESAATSGTTQAAQGAPRQRVSPIARRLAAEHGIDVDGLRGSGPDGRIVERDVMRAVEQRSQVAAAAPPAVASGPAAGIVPYSGRRRTIGERMLQSLASMAQLTLSSETSVDEAIKMLRGLNREWRREGVVVTLTALIVRACALALTEHPRLNSRLEGDRIMLQPRVNIGVAVDIDEGVIAPVILDVGALRLEDVARSVRQLTDGAKAGTLRPDDLSGGTFTVTSLEGTAVDAFTPVINPPQAAILGLGRVREIAAFDGPNVVRRQVTTLSLTFDHRVVDGAPAARFLDRVAELLDRPYLLM